jgi:hypothetical protein
LLTPRRYPTVVFTATAAACLSCVLACTPVRETWSRVALN